MFILTWDETFETGIEMIDDQHKELFYLINFFYHKCEKKVDYTEAIRLIDNLNDYSLRHFQAEESYMITSSYPKVYKHQASHKNISFEIKRFGTLMKDSGTCNSETAKEFLNFISEWLLTHVAKEDLDFVKYYNARKES